MTTEIAIQRVDAPPEAKPTKTHEGRWEFPIVYTLADGRELASAENRRLLRDAKAALAALPRILGNESTEFALFNDAGDWVGCKQVLRVGGQR